MNLAGLELAEHKTEAVLVTTRKQLETTTLKIGNHEFQTQPYVRYLGVMIDSRLSFKTHVDHIAAKASVMATTLARLMPNVGGSKQKRRRLLSSVVASVLLYGAPVWSDALQKEEPTRRISSAYRVSTLRVSSAFRTVSADAACVISGMLPIEILSEERRNLYRRKKAYTDLTTAELKVQERRRSLQKWQLLWDTSNKGRWTHRLIPNLEIWVKRKHGEVNYYLTQMLSGHGCYREYLHRFKHEDSPECPTCVRRNENAEHVFFSCENYKEARDAWEVTVGKVCPENLIEVMLSSETAWEATNAFVMDVLKDLRRRERARKAEIT